MIVPRRDNLRVAVCVIVSVTLHAIVILPMLREAMAHDAGAHEARPVDAEQTDAPESDLGIDADTPSSLTWIGYEEYEEHIAKRAEWEQAAMASVPPSGVPTPSEAQQPLNSSGSEDADAAPTTPVEPTRPEQSAASPTYSDAPPLVTSNTAPAGIRSTVQFDATIELPEIDGEPMVYLPPREQNTTRPVGPRLVLFDAMNISDSPAPSRRLDARREPVESAADDLPPVDVTVAVPSEAGASGAPAREGEKSEPNDQRGDVTDRESDPFSTIDVPPDKWKTGKPVAAPGLELKPRKPEFTLLTLLTAAPRNPLVRMQFDHRGIVTKADILKSSGDSRVDKAVRDSLYGWRGQGATIDALDEKSTHPVTMRIILVEERRK